MGDTASHGSADHGNKRKKNYYHHQSNKKHKKNSLMPGLSGFLFTCNRREYDCVREGYNLLNEYYEASGSGEDGKPGDNIEQSLAEELKELKEKPKLFQQLLTKCNNVLFVEGPADVNPKAIAAKLFGEIEREKIQKCRHLLKFIPVLKTCKTTEASMKQALEEILDQESDAETTYMVISKVRCNSELTRFHLVQFAADIVSQKRPSWKVNFDEPKIVISIDILQKVCCISVLQDYFHFSKYNPVEFSQKVTKSTQVDEEGASAAQTVKTTPTTAEDSKLTPAVNDAEAAETVKDTPASAEGIEAVATSDEAAKVSSTAEGVETPGTIEESIEKPATVEDAETATSAEGVEDGATSNEAMEAPSTVKDVETSETAKESAEKPATVKDADKTAEEPIEARVVA